MSSTRKRICAIMNKERSDFEKTPFYDDFLESREDLINKFVQLYDTTGLSGLEGVSATREELEKILRRFELDNQEQIINTRSEDTKRQKIQHIIEIEGTLYDRINVDYSKRDSVIDHELAVQYADLLSRGEISKKTLTSLDLINRKTRLIKQTNVHEQTSVPLIAEASGCKDVWIQRGLSVIRTAFAQH